MKKILVFGTFDGIHKGHEFFLLHAKEQGDHLTVSVARDEHIRSLKEREPRNGEQERHKAIEALDMVDEAHLSDEILGTYQIIKDTNPDLIVLGFDQFGLEIDLKRWQKESGSSIAIERYEAERMDVVLAICERDGRILLNQRMDKRPIWDKKWEFPGGKVDKGEDILNALYREVNEETGLDILSHEKIGVMRHDWHLEDHTRAVDLHVFKTQMGEGESKIEEGKAYQAKWFDLSETYPDDIDLLGPNREVLNRFYLN